MAFPLFGPPKLEASIAKQFYALALVVCVVYFAFISFLYGQAYSPNPGSIVIHVVDLDGGPIGTALTSAVSKILNDSSVSGAPIPAFTIVSTPTIDDVLASVSGGDAWGAIVASKNASASLQRALRSAVIATSTNGSDAAAAGAIARSYNASAAFTIVFDEGRQAQVVASVVAGPLRNLAARIGAQYAVIQATTRGTSLTSLLGTEFAYLITNPLLYSEVNIHPNTASVVNLAVSLGSIFLLVFSVFGTLLILNATQTPEVVGTYDPFPLIFLRIRLGLPFALLLSLFSTVLMTIFGVNWSSGSNFASTWFLQALTVLTYVSIFTVLISIPKLGLPLPIMVVLIILVIFNVVSGVATVDLASPFYKFAYGFPAYNTGAAIRTFVFGSYNRLGVNTGIIASWLAFFSLIALALVFSGIERRRVQKESAPIEGGDKPADNNAQEAEIGALLEVDKSAATA
ncbi:hypothetical protein BJ742DRAFT_819671 [Cladochytrium replicatum]|nr:hypothetical protein BJ742DRAFT_819671 [Cladochytrium replicatum]